MDHSFILPQNVPLWVKYKFRYAYPEIMSEIKKKYKTILVTLIIITLLASSIFYIVFIESKNNNNKDHKKQFLKPEYPPLTPITLPHNESLYIVFGAFEAKNNEPVLNAKISLFLHNITLTNYTDDNGFTGFEINFSVPKSHYEVRTEARDYETLIYKIELEILVKNNY